MNMEIWGFTLQMAIIYTLPEISREQASVYYKGETILGQMSHIDIFPHVTSLGISFLKI